MSELKPCPCGKLPHISRNANPRQLRNILGDPMPPSKPYVSIQCKRHDGILVNVHMSGDTIDEAERLGVEIWNTRVTEVRE